MKYGADTWTLTKQAQNDFAAAHTKLERSMLNITIKDRKVKKVKAVFIYSAVSSPLDRSKRFTIVALPDRPVHSDTNSASPGNILARQQLRAKTKSLTFPPLSTARYSFIQLSQQGRH